MYVALVQDDQTGQQEGLVMMWAPSNTSGQQHAAFPLVMKNQSQQSHHQHEYDRAADDSVGDAGVVAQMIVQRHEVLKVLAGSFCEWEEEEWRVV